MNKKTPQLTEHVSLKECTIENCEVKSHDIQHLLKERYNIDHSTIQFEKYTCGSCFHSKPDDNYCCSMCIDKCRYNKDTDYINIESR